jgi:hypothetical protein
VVIKAWLDANNLEVWKSLGNAQHGKGSWGGKTHAADRVARREEEIAPKGIKEPIDSF